MDLLRKLKDSEIDNKKISYKDEFELVYLRHRYFRKTNNPSSERIGKFEEMIGSISGKVYFDNIEVFMVAGFEVDDIKNIGRVHAVSFIGIQGLYENEDEFQKFRERHKAKYGEQSEPSEKDIFRKEAYDLARFLNQRLQECANICKNKNANIRGSRDTFKAFVGKGEEVTDYQLLNNCTAHGYKIITGIKFKEMFKKSKSKNKNRFINENGEVVRSINLKGSDITEEEFEMSGLDPRDGVYYANPEDIVSIRQQIKSYYK